MFVYIVDIDGHRICEYARELCLETLPNLDTGKLTDDVPCTFNDSVAVQLQSLTACPIKRLKVLYNNSDIFMTENCYERLRLYEKLVRPAYAIT